MVSIHPCDMLWQGTLSSLITWTFMPPTAPSIFSLSNFIISWSCWIQWLRSSERLRQRGSETGYKIPISASPCIPLPSSSSSPVPRVPLCNLYAFLLPVLWGQQKLEVGCRVKHPAEQIAIAKCALITLSPQQLRDLCSKFPVPLLLGFLAPRRTWWMALNIHQQIINNNNLPASGFSEPGRLGLPMLSHLTQPQSQF